MSCCFRLARPADSVSFDFVLFSFLSVSMQTHFHSRQAADLRSIRDRLAIRFGKIRIAERPDPVSQLIGSILGSRTRDATSRKAFVRLAAHFRDWNAIADAQDTDIAGLIGDVTFPEKKALDLKNILRGIRKSSGQIDLDFLFCLEAERALRWLERFHGVGRKTSAAALNFSYLRGRVFVIDTHVLRVLRRFGFVGQNTPAREAYDAVMAASDCFDADDLFELHWFLKSLGHKTCSHGRAACFSCPLSDICLRRLEGGARMDMRVSAAAA
jgi:endonuclease III